MGLNLDVMTHRSLHRCSNQVLSISEVSSGWLNQQTLGNPTWINDLEQIIGSGGGGTGARVPRHTVFLSPQWTPASIGPPYFTTLAQALAYVASQNPTSIDPWTILIYPGFYATDPTLNMAFQGDTHDQRVDQNDNMDRRAVCPDAMRSILAMAQVSMRNKRLLDMRAVMDHDATVVKQVRRLMAPQLKTDRSSSSDSHPADDSHPSCKTHHPDQEEMIDIQTLTDPFEETQLIQPETCTEQSQNNMKVKDDDLCIDKPVTHERKTIKSRIFDKQDVHAESILTMTPNVILHAVAKDTVIVDDLLVFDNVNQPSDVLLGFENLIYTQGVNYTRTSIDTRVTLHFDNCDFVDLAERGNVGLSVISSINASVPDQFLLQDCHMGQACVLNLLASGLVADIQSLTSQLATINIGTIVPGQDSVSVNLNVANDRSSTIVVQGTSTIRLSGDTSTTTVLVQNTSDLQLSDSALLSLELQNAALMRGSGSIQTMRLFDNSIGLLNGSCQNLFVDANARLDFNGVFNNVTGTGTFNPAMRQFRVLIPINTTINIQVPFGTSYSNNNYNVVATVFQTDTPSNVNSVQIVTKNLNNLSVRTNAARPYEMWVDLQVALLQPNVVM